MKRAHVTALYSMLMSVCSENTEDPISQRIGQFLDNAVSIWRQRKRSGDSAEWPASMTGNHPDLFYVSDEDLIEAVKYYLKNFEVVEKDPNGGQKKA